MADPPRRGAELATGEPSPDDEPLDVTITKAGPWWVYVVETVGEDVDDSIAALPPDLQAAFAELLAALEISPRTVTPLVPSDPTAYAWPPSAPAARAWSSTTSSNGTGASRSSNSASSEPRW
ncbi:hypothetical protein Acsp06_50750 [Actinomycetospora sp. NBRC 106375]|nr:hypothetical protein Acsp06_50750 [Actinomycetospora sp. NBRC 106375]